MFVFAALQGRLGFLAWIADQWAVAVGVVILIAFFYLFTALMLQLPPFDAEDEAEQG